MIKTLIAHRGLQTIVAIVLYATFASHLSLEVHEGLYTISVLIKDILMWMLPVTVFFYIAHTLVMFEKRAPLFILALVMFEFISNMSSVWTAFGWAHLMASHISLGTIPHDLSSLTPLFKFPIARPLGWSADKGCLLGVITGLSLAITNAPSIKMWIYRGKEQVQRILTQGFSRCIPVFVLGFIAQMRHSGIAGRLLEDALPLLGILILILSLYISLIFILGGRYFWFRHLVNLFPAGGMALTSGCSLSTMPLTIQGTSKNLEHPNLASAIIPATTNIQQVGDCLTNALLCAFLHFQFLGSLPSLSIWAIFSIAFVFARFAVAAVIGGAIFIMLPIYETYLNFTPEMIALILAYNVVLDPLVTATNVIANGGLCRIFERIWMRLHPPAIVDPIKWKSLSKTRVPLEKT